MKPPVKRKEPLPYLPADYELADATALQAVLRGEADSAQQQRALKWIIEQAAGMYEFKYFESERDTAFALGRGFVGQQIVKLTKLNVSSMRRMEDGTQA